MNYCFCLGMQYGFYSGDVLKISDDIGVLRPTIFSSVPRLFNKIYDRMTAGVKEAGGKKQDLFYKALKTKIANLENKAVYTHGFYDKLVFKKL